MIIHSEKKQLIGCMKEVVETVMESFKSDFTEHDVKTIEDMENIEPFFWLVRRYGTHIARKSCKKSIENMLIRINFQFKQRDDFLLYHYENGALNPVFPRLFSKWAKETFEIPTIDYYN